MDSYYYMLAFMIIFVAVVLFLLTRSANRIAKERAAEAEATGDAGSATPMGATRQRRARRED
jgi:flagellar biosynthesis/type III secretory pathway M-ring protein FliF/YscJ